tara:strand:- start:99 stop:986 length:888 start_codon:yes stop_codon:yes gene_type:complete
MWTNEHQPDEFGFQVLLSVHNGENYMKRCLASLDEALVGRNWVLLYGDDESEDESTIELARYARALTCDKVHLYEYNKAANVGTAKNRLIKECHNYKKDYPYILFMDVDDQMLVERPRMAHTASAQEKGFVVGDWENETLEAKESKYLKAENVSSGLNYGPWATLFHHSFLPEDGLFFPEDELSNCGYEDCLTWYHLKYIENKIATPHLSGQPVHKYISRENSVSRGSDMNHKRNTFWGITRLIKEEKRNIYTNPPSAEEISRERERYIASRSSETDVINSCLESAENPANPHNP